MGCFTLCSALLASTAWAGPPPLALRTLTLTAVVGQADDAAAKRRDSDQWLQRARQAMKEGKLELAQDYLVRAEKTGAVYESIFARFVDTPEKVRRDLDAMRKSGPIGSGGPSDSSGPSDPLDRRRRHGEWPAKRSVQTVDARSAARSRHKPELGRGSTRFGHEPDAAPCRRLRSSGSVGWQCPSGRGCRDGAGSPFGVPGSASFARPTR
jgi:hypothetical protein